MDHDAEASLLAIALTQHGALGTHQVRGLPIGTNVITRLVRSHFMSRQGCRSLTLGPPDLELDEKTQRAVGVLDCGANACLHAATAIAHRTEWRPRDRTVHVMSPQRGSRSDLPFVIRHRFRGSDLERAEVVDGLMCASLVDAIISMGAHSTDLQVANALQRIRFLDHANLLPIRNAAERFRWRHGLPTLRAALELLDAGSAGTKNRLEDAAARLVRELVLPETPLFNVRGCIPGMPDYEPDIVLPDAKVIIEVLGGYHDADHQRVLDDRRSDDAAEHGYLTLELRWHDIYHDRSRTSHHIARTVANRMPEHVTTIAL